MVIRIAIVILLALSAAAQTTPSTTSAPPTKPPKVNSAFKKLLGNYAYWWNSLSGEEKDSFVDGFTTAMSRVESVTNGFAKDARNKLTTGPTFDEQMKTAMLLSLLSSEFDYKGSNDSLRAGLDDFYKDPLNARIMVSLALGHVRDQLEGRKTAGQLLDELNDWRKIVNRNSN
jgi:hypothetical protein